MTTATTRREHAETLFAKPAISADRRADGSTVVKSTTPLGQSARCVGDWLEHWARQAPERIFLGDRAGADAPWRTVTYAAALRQVRAAASWILAQGLSAERPLVILADNSVDHALFALAAQHVGVPTAAISPAYSLMSKDFDKLKGMIKLLGPGAIYVTSTRPFAAALGAIKPLHRATIVSGNPDDAERVAIAYCGPGRLGVGALAEKDAIRGLPCPMLQPVADASCALAQRRRRFQDDAAVGAAFGGDRGFREKRGPAMKIVKVHVM